MSTYWFRLFSFIHPPNFKLSNNYGEMEMRLQMLKETFHSNINRLQVSNCTEILPIYTSTRCKIPKSKILELRFGNSVDNILKLLRIYAKFCYELVIYPNSLEKLALFCLKGLAYESLRCLSIRVNIIYYNSKDSQLF